MRIPAEIPGLLLSADQRDIMHAALIGSRDGIDRGAYVIGYNAALRDMNGSMSMERARIMYADPGKAANRSYDTRDSDGEDWLAPLVVDGPPRPTHAVTPAERRATKAGWVYAFTDGADVKIGWTGDDVRKRASSVRHASGRDVAVAGYVQGTRADERALHDRFAAARIRGEWFRRTPEIDAWLATL